MNRRRRPMRRIGDLLPGAAAALGLEAEFAHARAIATWDRLVSEHLPPAAGRTSLVAVRGDTIVVSASEPIVAQELRLRAGELLEAFAAARGGAAPRQLRIVLGTAASHLAD